MIAKRFSGDTPRRRVFRFGFRCFFVVGRVLVCGGRSPSHLYQDFNIFLWIQNGVSIIFVINLVCHVVGCNWNAFVGIIAETGGKMEVHKLSF